jgi:hypothetical protein
VRRAFLLLVALADRLLTSLGNPKNTFGLDSKGRCFFLRSPCHSYSKHHKGLIQFLDWMRDVYKIPDSLRKKNLRGNHSAPLVGRDRQIKKACPTSLCA